MAMECGQVGPTEHRTCVSQEQNPHTKAANGRQSQAEGGGEGVWPLSRLAWGNAGLPGAGPRGGQEPR